MVDAVTDTTSTNEQTRDTAKRLKLIYETKKKDLGITQKLLGKQLGMTQGNVANYMRGGQSMNLQTVLKFAKALQVDPLEIDPDLLIRLNVSPVLGKTTATVIGTIEGRQPKQRTAEARGLTIQNHHLGFEVDTDCLAPMILEGGIIYVDPRRDIETGDNLLLCFRDTGRSYPYNLIKRRSDGGVKVMCYARPGYIPEDSEERLYPTHEQPLEIPGELIRNMYYMVGCDNHPT